MLKRPCLPPQFLSICATLQKKEKEKLRVYDPLSTSICGFTRIHSYTIMLFSRFSIFFQFASKMATATICFRYNSISTKFRFRHTRYAKLAFRDLNTPGAVLEKHRVRER